MRLIEIYQCLCDETRLRILHLLTHGPLCVCHFQSVLGVPQTRVSQHLAYLRKRGLVECTRRGTWMIYALPANSPPELEKHLRCLQDCVQSDQMFRSDLEKLREASACGNQPEFLKSSCDC
jgi:ArsR family transcriptional regulator